MIKCLLHGRLYLRAFYKLTHLFFTPTLCIPSVKKWVQRSQVICVWWRADSWSPAHCVSVCALRLGSSQGQGHRRMRSCSLTGKLKLKQWSWEKHHKDWQWPVLARVHAPVGSLSVIKEEQLSPRTL
jgi:hypothetical protein